MLKAQFLTYRKMASILDPVQSYLVALPFLRLVPDQLAKFSNMHLSEGWDFKISIPEKLKTQLRELNELLVPGFGRPFSQKCTGNCTTTVPPTPGGLEPSTGNFIQEFWREKSSLHINEKELLASVSTFKSLARLGETVRLNVDNTVAYRYLTKWGRKIPRFNEIVKPLMY